MTTANKTTQPTIDATITTDPMRLVLSFANGKTIEVDPATLPSTIRDYAVLHGLKQKLVDGAAISRNPETGRAASVDDKYDAVAAIYERLIAGQWNKTRDGGATTASGGLLFRALCRMYAGKKSAEEIREYLVGKTDADKASLRKNSRVAAVIEEIRAESAKTDGVDADGLLDELEG